MIAKRKGVWVVVYEYKIDGLWQPYANSYNSRKKGRIGVKRLRSMDNTRNVTGPVFIEFSKEKQK